MISFHALHLLSTGSSSAKVHVLSVQSPLSGRLTVAVMTPGHYIDGFERTYTDCPWRDRHIACDFLNATDPFVWLRAGALTAPQNASIARYIFNCAVP